MSRGMCGCTSCCCLHCGDFTQTCYVLVRHGETVSAGGVKLQVGDHIAKRWRYSVGSQSRISIDSPLALIIAGRLLAFFDRCAQRRRPTLDISRGSLATALENPPLQRAQMRHVEPARMTLVRPLQQHHRPQLLLRIPAQQRHYLLVPQLRERTRARAPTSLFLLPRRRTAPPPGEHSLCSFPLRPLMPIDSCLP